GAAASLASRPHAHIHFLNARGWSGGRLACVPSPHRRSPLGPARTSDMTRIQTRPPHPPSAGGRLADLVRRARLTLRYHGPRELAFRLVTFPLRATPFGARVGHGRRYGPETARARRWYAENGRPVTVVVHGSG